MKFFLFTPGDYVSIVLLSILSLGKPINPLRNP